jgi:serine/threonine-protein kinase
LTPQTDLYALGCVFYELLTGKPPYVGESPAQTMHMHCRSDIPRVSQSILDCPPGLEKLIAKLMAKEPSQRPQSAAEVARELRTVSNTITVKIDPKRLLIEGGAEAPPLPPVMRSDFGEPIVGPYKRSKSDQITLVGLIVALVGSLVWSLSRDNHHDLATQLESQWIEAIRDPHREVRIRAINSLGALEGRSPNGLEAVSQVLEDYDPGVRVAAVVAVSKAGTAGKPFIPTLMRLSKDDQDRDIRDMAGTAVSKLRQAPDPSNWKMWLMLTGLACAGGYGVYVWMHRASQETPLPVRRPVLGTH